MQCQEHYGPLKISYHYPHHHHHYHQHVISTLIESFVGIYASYFPPS